MSGENLFSRWLKVLAGYYGILQSLHLFFLIRAGFIYINSGSIPFPAPPPDAGWSSQVIPFLFAMGALDAAAAFLGIYSAIILVRKNQFDSMPWILSLVLALASAIIFVVGTVASGAWLKHPAAYGILVVFFSPLFPLFLLILRKTGTETRSM
ncbi:MAG: hypothetical protein MUO54_09850 [Anaerolineales bacterium]|nr:hypothetical protein [Anaerolineales bacterium]